MPIYPLPQFEADLAEQDRGSTSGLKPLERGRAIRRHENGRGVSVRRGKPRCGSKLSSVLTAAPNSADAHQHLPQCRMFQSVTRNGDAQYIENSGGKDYPFFPCRTRSCIATQEDLAPPGPDRATKPQLTMSARRRERTAAEREDRRGRAAPGGERLTFYFTSEDRRSTSATSGTAWRRSTRPASRCARWKRRATRPVWSPTMRNAGSTAAASSS